MRWYPHPVWPHIAWDGEQLWRRQGKLSQPMKREVWLPICTMVNSSASARQMFVFKKPYNVGRVIKECATGESMPRGAWTDHIDGDFENNAPRNIRWVTPAGNNRNRRGVARVRRSPHGAPSWIAYGCVSKRYIHVGSFRTKREATAAATSFANKQLKKEIIHG